VSLTTCSLLLDIGSCTLAHPPSHLISGKVNQATDFDETLSTTEVSAIIYSNYARSHSLSVISSQYSNPKALSKSSLASTSPSTFAATSISQHSSIPRSFPSKGGSYEGSDEGLCDVRLSVLCGADSTTSSSSSGRVVNQIPPASSSFWSKRKRKRNGEDEVVRDVGVEAEGGAEGRDESGFQGQRERCAVQTAIAVSVDKSDMGSDRIDNGDDSCGGTAAEMRSRTAETITPRVNARKLDTATAEVTATRRTRASVDRMAASSPSVASHGGARASSRTRELLPTRLSAPMSPLSSNPVNAATATATAAAAATTDKKVTVAVTVRRSSRLSSTRPFLPLPLSLPLSLPAARDVTHPTPDSCAAVTHSISLPLPPHVNLSSSSSSSYASTLPCSLHHPHHNASDPVVVLAHHDLLAHRASSSPSSPSNTALRLAPSRPLRENYLVPPPAPARVIEAAAAISSVTTTASLPSTALSRPLYAAPCREISIIPLVSSVTILDSTRSNNNNSSIKNNNTVRSNSSSSSNSINSINLMIGTGTGSGCVGVQSRRSDTSSADSRTDPSSAHSLGSSHSHSHGFSSERRSAGMEKVNRPNPSFSSSFSSSSSSAIPKHSTLPVPPSSSSSSVSSSSSGALTHLSLRRALSVPLRAPSLPLPLPATTYRHASFKAKRMLQAAEGIIANKLKTQAQSGRRKDPR
jgi:hypothetical protein